MNKKKEDKIIRLLMQIQAIWEQEHPNQILSMAVSEGYLSAFSMVDNEHYIFNRSIIKGTELYRSKTADKAEGGKNETV